MLRLTPQEAAALRILLSKVGGDMEDTLRKYTQSVYNALPEEDGMWFHTQLVSVGTSFTFNSHKNQRFLNYVEKLRLG